MNVRVFVFLLFSVSVVAAIGCSDKVPMRGKVTFSDDQSPLTAGTVTFQSDTVLARGDLQPDGTYVLGTLKQADGIPKGTYHVTISDTMGMFTRGGERIIGPPPPLPPGEIIMRPLIAPMEPKTVVVDGTQREFNIVVDRP